MVDRITYRTNRFEGTCEACGQTVPSGCGRVRLARNPDRWITSHKPTTWQGSPVSGGWVGGCTPATPTPDTTEDTLPDPERGELARKWLYFQLTGDSDDPPPLVDPGTDGERTQLIEAFIRLADHVDHNPLPGVKALAELHAIAAKQGWT